MIAGIGACLAEAGGAAAERAAVFVAASEEATAMFGATEGFVLLATAGALVVLAAAALVLTARSNASNADRLAALARRLAPPGGPDA